MAMREVYVIRIQPKQYSNFIQLAYLFKPTYTDIIDSLNNILSKTKSTHYSKFLNKCIRGVDMYKLPVIRENDTAIMHWKYPGDSIYNSKGKTELSIIRAYEKDKK